MTKRMAYQMEQIQARERILQRRRMHRHRVRLYAFLVWVAVCLVVTVILGLIGRLA